MWYNYIRLKYKSGGKMRIERRYHGEEKAELVTIEEAIEILEGRGYYKEGTIRELVDDFAKGMTTEFTLRSISACYTFKN